MGTLLCPPFNCGLLDYCSPLHLPGSSSAEDCDASGGLPLAHRNVFKESFKALEADIMHANTLLSGEMLRDSEGATLQMRLSFSPLAPLLLFLVQWADCSLAGALGLLRILIYKVYRNGHSTANIYERKATLRQFCGVLYPALQQLYPGVSESEFREQQRECREKFLGKRRQTTVSCSCGRALGVGWGGGGPSGTGSAGIGISSSSSSNSSSLSSFGHGVSSLGIRGSESPGASTCVSASGEWRALDRVEEGRSCCAAARAMERERERECGICMEEQKAKVVLPSCGHCLCKTCFNDWNTRSESCPFCRRGLPRVGSGDLWEMVELADAQDLARITRDNIRRFFIFVHSLPVVFADALMDVTPSERRPLM